MFCRAKQRLVETLANRTKRRRVESEPPTYLREKRRVHRDGTGSYQPVTSIANRVTSDFSQGLAPLLATAAAAPASNTQPAEGIANSFNDISNADGNLVSESCNQGVRGASPAQMRMGQKQSGGIQTLSSTPRDFHINRPNMTILRSTTADNKHSQKQAQQHNDYQKPLRLDVILEQPAVSQDVAEKHTWNPEDRSLNIYVKPDDPFTLHRHPVAQSTDCIRAKQGYERGLHVFEVTWNKQQRGTHAVVGVGEKLCMLHCAGYMSLVGNSKHSWGWDIGRMKVYHDNRVQTASNAQSYPVSRDINENFSVPDKFLMVLDMDEGTLSYVVDGKYQGVAFGGLKGKKLFPMVSAVWGHCEVGLRYIGGLERELIQ